LYKYFSANILTLKLKARKKAREYPSPFQHLHFNKPKKLRQFRDKMDASSWSTHDDTANITSVS
jgi:hypothetical protein